jgi:glycosyltransferase involved in cell wall biosynthesis
MALVTRPQVSIIIPVYNGGAAFKACLQSLDRYLPNPATISTEVIVVADGCTDGSDRLAEQFGAIVLKAPAQTPSGPAQARNLGARHAQGDILFFVDADVTIHPDTIDRVVETFTREPELAATIGSYDDAPGALNFLSQYKNLFHHYTHQTGQEDASTFWGACGAIRRDIFWSVGGFDEQYRKPSIEDIELGYRLKAHGYSIRLCKSLHVKHLKRWEPVSLLRAEFFYRALPWTELLLNQSKVVNDLNLKLSTRFSVVLVFAILALMLGGYWWPASLGMAGLLGLVLIAINFSVYQFFYQKRGLWFTVRMLPWHWLYFLYSGLAYGIGFCRHHLLNQSLSPQING